jgi:Helix-turn-helix domain
MSEHLTPLAVKVRTHLRTHRHITAMDAMRAYGLSSGSLTRRLTELRQAGERITRTRKVDPITRRPYGVWTLEQKAA